MGVLPYSQTIVILYLRQEAPVQHSKWAYLEERHTIFDPFAWEEGILVERKRLDRPPQKQEKGLLDYALMECGRVKKHTELSTG
ncbi:hypothetical protein ANN_18487 [Periplaneta americana]|uniref:Uncharacterized protein n=1 Tax=Periplaneta americana TaxID=6978 RepID=A0ABQ8SNW1_PERAM|nr:hypothetical protein ANN_18487 [Periplaneta americana]